MVVLLVFLKLFRLSVGFLSQLVQVFVEGLDLSNVLLLQSIELALYIDFTDKLVVRQFQKAVFTLQIVVFILPILDLVQVPRLHFFQVSSCWLV